MKTKILQTGKIAVLIFFPLLASITTAFGQNDTSWQAIGIDTVFTNKHVKINNTLDVYGRITADSMRIRGSLYIGDSTLALKNNISGPGGFSDQIRSTQGRIALMGGGENNFNSNISIGIGVHYPTAKVDLNYDNTGNLKIGFNNRAMSGGNSAGNLHIDCLSPGAIRLNQYVASNIIMATGGGKVGIGLAATANPVSVVHIAAFIANTGLLFRTDGKKTAENKWQLYTGTNANNATEKFKTSVPANSDDAVLQVSQTGGRFFC